MFAFSNENTSVWTGSNKSHATGGCNRMSEVKQFANGVILIELLLLLKLPVSEGGVISVPRNNSPVYSAQITLRILIIFFVTYSAEVLRH